MGGANASVGERCSARKCGTTRLFRSFFVESPSKLQSYDVNELLLRRIAASRDLLLDTTINCNRYRNLNSLFSCPFLFSPTPFGFAFLRFRVASMSSAAPASARAAALAAVASLFSAPPSAAPARGRPAASVRAPASAAAAAAAASAAAPGLGRAALGAIASSAGATLLPAHAAAAARLPEARAAVLGLSASLPDAVAGAPAGRKRGRGGAAAAGGAPAIEYASAAGIDAAAAGGGKRARGAGAGAGAGADAAAAVLAAAAAAAAQSSAATARALADSSAAALASAGAGGGAAQPRRGARVPAAARADAGAAWFGMPATELTAEVKRDLLLLRHRAYLDPKQHYKGGGVDGGRLMQLPRFFQVGTVVDAAGGARPSAALPRAQRNVSLVDAMLADERLRQYAKKNYDAVAETQLAGGRKAYHARKGQAAAAGAGRGGRRKF
jgi:hypothetical protein